MDNVVTQVGKREKVALVVLVCLLGSPVLAQEPVSEGASELQQQGPEGSPSVTSPQPKTVTDQTNQSVAPSVRGEVRKGFFQRFYGAYFEEAENAPTPPRRLPPGPYNSPPFPFSEHLGPAIGLPDTTPDYYTLMRALKDTAVGDALNNSRVRVYGWLNPSFNWSTSKNSNIPLTYAIVPNSFQMSQAVLKFERGLDTAQTDHMDWGFRFSNLYGIDYRWTMAKGIFSSQLFDRNQLYGYDPVEAYGQVYIPGVAEGVIVKFGRFISPPDIEAQLSPDNYLMTHSVMFAYDPYTFMGMLATIRLNTQWTIDLGVHGGNDMALWSNSAQPNGHAMVKWVASDNNDSIWFGANSIGSGKFTNEHDNLQHLVAVWSHRFTDTVHMETEGYYLWQRGAARGGSCINGPTRPFASGGGCGPTIPGVSRAYGAVNYFNVEVSKTDYITFRNDMLYDVEGQRTGFNTIYGEHTLGWVHWFSNELLIRPEIRHDHSWTNVSPYDNGTRKNQGTVSMDMIWRF